MNCNEHSAALVRRLRQTTLERVVLFDVFWNQHSFVYTPFGDGPLFVPGASSSISKSFNLMTHLPSGLDVMSLPLTCSLFVCYRGLA
jgi:hypothetical protein